MRMWMTDPKLLCNKHLLGEHGEIHKHRHNFAKKHSVQGRIYPKIQIQPSSMQSRHDALAKEMIRRGMNHQSPYVQPDISYLPDDIRNAKVNIDQSYHDLINRCKDCRDRIKGVYNEKETLVLS